MKLSKPINDWARCLYIIIENRESYVDMQKVLRQYPFFYKWQARLHDLKKILKSKGLELKINTETVPFKNEKLNKNGYYFKYRVMNTEPALKKMYAAINVVDASKK